MIEHMAAEVETDPADAAGAAGDGGWSLLGARAVAADRRGAAARAAAEEPVELPVLAPPVGLSAGPLGAVQAAEREIARHSALRARAVAAFAASRPASADRPQGTRGAMSPARWAARPEVLREVSEWAAPELSVALSVTQTAAQTLLERSLTLVHRLPGTLAALEAGALHAGHLFPMLEHVAPIGEDRVRAQVEAGLLRWAAGRVTTPAQLGQKARREVLRRDARAAARKLAAALAARGVSVHPDPTTSGMGVVTAALSWPEARALHGALAAYADALPADPADRRSRGQRMADILLDLVLRPGQSETPPVQVALTLVAPVATALGGDAPGEIDGHVVPAEMVRALLHALTGHPTAAPSPPPAEPPGAEPADEPPGEALRVEPPGWGDTDEELSVPERLALKRSWAERERRIFADELTGPDPLPTGEELNSWAAQLDPWRAEDPAQWEAWAAMAGPLDPGAAEDVLDAPEPAVPGDGPAPPGVGWWAAADRAVETAGRAVHEAQSALGHARALVATAERAEATDERAWQDSPAGRMNAATHALEALAVADATARDGLADLLYRTAGGGLTDRPRLAVTDVLTGALLALTDLPALRRAASCGAPACRRRPHRCTHDLTGRPGLGAPPATDGYRPAADLDRFVRARDRRCRMPGCRRPVPKTGHLDHNTRYPDGPTAAANLAGYCTPDHRGKHQAPGWTHQLAPDGTLTVTTPTGLVAVTTPPPY